MSKHTPGPWSIGSADNYTRRTIVGPREGMSHKLIARMPGEYRENHAIFPEMLANAHLIAAAPAMYEALTHALSVCEAEAELRGENDIDDYLGGAAGPVARMIRAALAQAEARS